MCFFFKQKTAYEMRISDWSSDVCSSDLHLPRGGEPMSWTPRSWRSRPAAQMPDYPDHGALRRVEARLATAAPLTQIADIMHLRAQLGRASCRERVCQYV